LFFTTLITPHANQTSRNTAFGVEFAQILKLRKECFAEL